MGKAIKVHVMSKVSTKEDMNYWEKLKSFKMSSQERRRERYMVVFLWKISQGLVNGYSIQFTSASGRRGRTALPHEVVKSSPASVRRARESSLGVKGARIFNLLPVTLRNIDSNNVEVFKKELDTFLARIPDQPTTSGLGRAAESNSLLHQIQQSKLTSKLIFLTFDI